MPVDLSSTDQQALAALGRAVRAEADGKAMRRDLLKGLRGTADPIKAQARSNVMGISSGRGGMSTGAPLRSAVAQQIKIDTRLSGRSTGVRVRVPRRRGMPRDFANAPKALNSKKGWRRQVFGSGTWVQQIAVPAEWFDRATREHHQQLKEDVLSAMEAMARRIAAKGPFTGGVG